MLNLPLIRDRMVSQDLSQIALALKSDVDDERVARWLSGAAIPGPRAMGRLAKALGLDPADLFDSSATLPAPQVFWLGTLPEGAQVAAITPELDETGRDMGRQMRTLLSFLPEPPVLKPQLLTPATTLSDLPDALETLGIAPLLRCYSSERGQLAVLRQSLKEFGAILVPVMWISPDMPLSGAVIALPDSRDFFVYVNLRNSLDGIIRTLAEALGGCYAWTLPMNERAVFAKAFADAAGVANYSGDLETSPLRGSTCSAKEYLGVVDELFETPVYRVIKAWQVAEGGRNPAFLNSALGIHLSLAHDLSVALYPCTSQD
jgi:transcriptional regulator with XRE-family HTH domain